ncbi:MAG: hypothetical protein LBG60_13800 [Bifidobacteriaceae bacterium]|nr:hypothetical protein [Bifidobacteriaceae bacterium]
MVSTDPLTSAITRTITEWNLDEDFTIVTDDFQWVNIGAVGGHYTVTAVPDESGGPVPGYCEDPGPKARCWLPEGTDLDVEITPDPDFYLQSVKVDGLGEDLSGPGFDSSDGSYSFPMPVLSTTSNVTVAAAEPTPVNLPANELLTSTKASLYCSTTQTPTYNTPCVLGDPDGDVVAHETGSDLYWANFRTPDLDHLAFGLKPGSDYPATATISSHIYGGDSDGDSVDEPYGSELPVGIDGPAVAKAYIKTVDTDQMVTLYLLGVTVPGGTAPGSFLVTRDTDDPVLNGVPATTSQPDDGDDDNDGVSTWTIDTIEATDVGGSGVRAVVWAKADPADGTIYPDLADLVAASEAAQPPVSPQDEDLGICTEDPDQLGHFSCKISTNVQQNASGSLNVKFYAFDRTDNYAESDPVTFYHDQTGPTFPTDPASPDPTVPTEYSVVGCDLYSPDGVGSIYCPKAVDVVVTVSDDYIGFSTATGQVQSAPKLVAPMNETHGAVRLSFPDVPTGGTALQEQSVPCVLGTAAEVRSSGAACTAVWDSLTQTWEVTFYDIPSTAVGVASGTQGDVHIRSQLMLEAWDLYGNKSGGLLTRALEVENIKPKIQITPNQINKVPVAGRDWYADDAEIAFDVEIADCTAYSPGTCSDNPKQSGLQKYTVTVGSASVPVADRPSQTWNFAPAPAQALWVHHLAAGSAYGADLAALTLAGCEDEGECVITVQAWDWAGNTLTDTKSVYIDRVAPEVTKIAFNSSGPGEVANSGVNPDVAPTSADGYGHFAKDSVTVTVTVVDEGAQVQPVTGSGALTVELYVRDEGAQETAPRPVGSRTVSANPDGTLTATFTLTGTLAGVVTGEFKGIVSAKVWDNVDNQVSEFFAQKKLVLESDAKHATESHVASNIAAKSLTKTGTDAEGLPLFAAATEIVLEVTDTYAGIQAIECTYTTEREPVARVCGGAVDKSAWTVLETDQNDTGAAIHAKYAFTVPDDSNDIAISWSVTDRAGHVTTAGDEGKVVKLSIDQTRPVISATWSNVSPDPENRTYYRADRVVTLDVVDRNFTASGAKIVTGGAASSWSQVGARRADGSETWRATITYTRDADYLARAEVTTVTDRAQNSLANPLALPDWTLDKTNPTIAISYDNNAATNGNFYGAARTATLTVQEHNFQASRVVLTETSALADGAQGAVGGFSWELGAWSSNGDTHTATLRFPSDGRFSFAATIADQAGNTGSALARQEFYIDQTKPIITIREVPAGEDLVDGAVFSFGEAIAPQVEVVDNINLGASDYGQVEVSLATVDGRNRVIAEPTTGSVAYGTTYTFAALPQLRASDGIYRLDVKATDNAAQEETKSALFMVNRFGSVYVFDSATSGMVDAANPVQEPTDLQITEYNVTPLVEREVKVIRNGQDTQVLGDTDFAVDSGTENGWNKATYSMPAALFAEEGSYEVRLWTKDEVGNVSQNDEPRDDAEDAAKIECGGGPWDSPIETCAEGAAVSFRIDKNPPTITVGDLQADTTYQVASLPVNFTVTDFFEDNIATVEVTVDGKPVEVQDMGDDAWQVTLASAFSPQSVVFKAVDKSGRESTREIGDVLVTSNKFALWFNNKPLFFGTVIGGAVAVFGLLWLFFWFRRRRRDNQEAGA